MAVVFAEDTRDTTAADPVPGKSFMYIYLQVAFLMVRPFEADWKKLCPIYDALAPGDL